MTGRPVKLYSVWANDDFDTLICLDATAKQAAALMGVELHNFYCYVTRPPKKYTIQVREKDKNEQIDYYRQLDPQPGIKDNDKRH